MKLTLELTDAQWAAVSQALAPEFPAGEVPTGKEPPATEEQVEGWLLLKLLRAAQRHQERAAQQRAAKSLTKRWKGAGNG